MNHKKATNFKCFYTVAEQRIRTLTMCMLQMEVMVRMFIGNYLKAYRKLLERVGNYLKALGEPI